MRKEVSRSVGDATSAVTEDTSRGTADDESIVTIRVGRDDTDTAVARIDEAEEDIAIVVIAIRASQDDIIEAENIEDIVIEGIRAIRRRIRAVREALDLNHNQKATNK